MVRRDSLLLELLRQPTAPFREQRVIDFLIETMTAERIPFFRDPIGNLVVGCASRAEYLKRVHAKTREPLRVYIAHLDHPGFHGVRWRDAKTLRVEWHGGAPTRHLEGADVWIAAAGPELRYGKMRAVRLVASGRTIATADVVFKTRLGKVRPAPREVYGGFHFRAPVWKSGAKLYTKAADDLVGAYSVLMTARAASRDRRLANSFVGLLTRAEEVGFIGAIGHFELGWLTRSRRPTLCVSLETSRTLPGADIGAGPVVRLGDRRTVFDPDAINVLTQVAERSLPGRFQRRIMDGGACEATAAIAYGLRAIGISVPLGNYHNESYQGGPDSRGPRGPAPEFVHRADIDGMVTLCRGLLAPGLAWNRPWDRERRNYQKRLKKSQSQLRLGRPK